MNVEKLKLIVSMVIFGTIGLFVRHISLPGSVIAYVRGACGVVLLLTIMLLTRKKLSFDAIKKNFVLLVASGGAVGINWVLLFESYRYTTVAVSTLCYYLAPTIVLVAAPFVLKERLTLKKGICGLVALFGMVLVSGVFSSENTDAGSIYGIAFGIGAAIVYASIIIMNKKIVGVGSYDKTVVQLAASAVVVFVYTLFSVEYETLVFTPVTIILLLILGIVHTGVAYYLYFSALGSLKAQTSAIFSYIDPVVAVIVSVVILHEGIDVYGIIGAVMILGSALVNELGEKA